MTPCKHDYLRARLDGRDEISWDHYHNNWGMKKKVQIKCKRYSLSETSLLLTLTKFRNIIISTSPLPLPPPLPLPLLLQREKSDWAVMKEWSEQFWQDIRHRQLRHTASLLAWTAAIWLQTSVKYREGGGRAGEVRRLLVQIPDCRRRKWTIEHVGAACTCLFILLRQLNISKDI